MIHYDMTGREIKIGDIVAKPWTVSGAVSLSVGKVIKIHEKSLTLQEIRFEEAVEGNYGILYTVVCEPYFDDDIRVRVPERCLILDPDMITKLNELKVL